MMQIPARLRQIVRHAAKVEGTLRAPSADVASTESEPDEPASPDHPLADAGLFVLTLAALVLVLVGMLMGPVAGLITPEL